MRTQAVYGVVVLATVFWGANFVLAEPVLADLPPLWAAALRFILGSGVMFLLARWRSEPLAELVRHNAGIYALLGVIGIGAFNLLFFYALKSTSPTNAALIMATNPLLTTVIAALTLGERPSARQIGALPIALAGVVVVISGGSLDHLEKLNVARGDLLMLAANLAWSMYNVLGTRYMPRSGSAVANTTLVMIAGAAMLLTAALTEGGGLPPMPGITALSALLTMVLAGTVLAYLFWTTGITNLGAGRTALFLNLVPVFAMFAGMLGGTFPTHVQLIGGAIVISGVSLAMVSTRRSPSASE